MTAPAACPSPWSNFSVSGCHRDRAANSTRQDNRHSLTGRLGFGRLSMHRALGGALTTAVDVPSHQICNPYLD